MSPDRSTTEPSLDRFSAAGREYFRYILIKKMLIRGMQANITQTDASTWPQKLTSTRSSWKLHVSQERERYGRSFAYMSDL